MVRKQSLDVHGTKVEVTNLQKIFYPKAGLTKGDVIDYYVRISSVLLPHLKDRPITLKRYPDGVDGNFLQKRMSGPSPQMGQDDQSRQIRRKINYCVINDLPSLVWAANWRLELHTFLHKAPAVQRPTAIAFDLDPGPPADIVLCCEVGLWLKGLFEAFKMESFAKTSGSKGLQVYIPINSAATYDKTKAFSHAIAELLESQRPEMVVSKMQKSLRSGKVLVDWSQNDDHKTTVNVYSLRAKDYPTVSTPVTWEEVESVVRKRNPNQLSFEAKEVLKRVEKMGDLFAPVLILKQKMPSLSVIQNLKR